MSGVASSLAKKRALAAGFGTNANAVPYLNQNFAALRAECLSAGKLFCDPAFPAAPEALGFKELGRSSYKVRGVTWKRPAVRVTGFGSGPGPVDKRVWWCFFAGEGFGTVPAVVLKNSLNLDEVLCVRCDRSTLTLPTKYKYHTDALH